MTGNLHPILERIVRWPKPSAERFAAAAAVYGLELMLQLAATPGAAGGPPSPGCDNSASNSPTTTGRRGAHR